MAWVAFDRAIKIARRSELDAPLDRWTAVRERIHREICERGFNREKNTFTQSYGEDALDASLLMLPLVGFLPIEDTRIAGTIAAIERELLVDGFVIRYDTHRTEDGLEAGEGAFLACSFWLVDNYILQGRHADARRLFERLSGLQNDVGLMSEEYDPVSNASSGIFHRRSATSHS